MPKINEGDLWLIFCKRCNCYELSYINSSHVGIKRDIHYISAYYIDHEDSRRITWYVPYTFTDHSEYEFIKRIENHGTVKK